MIFVPNDPWAWAAVCMCVWWHTCALAHVFVVLLALLLAPVVVIGVWPCGSVSVSFFPVVVGPLPLVVASLVWRDLCCLLTWCLPAQLCLLSGLQEWLAFTLTHHSCRLLRIMLSKVFFLLLYGVSNYFLPCFSGRVCKRSFVIYAGLSPKRQFYLFKNTNDLKLNIYP